MNPLDYIFTYKAFAQQMADKVPLTTEQFEWLEKAFTALANTQDPKIVFGLKHQSGNSLNKDYARTNTSLVLHWISAAIEKDPETNERMSLQEAFQKGAEMLNKLNGGQVDRYDDSYIQKLWYQFPHMQSSIRSPNDLDHPYPPASGNKPDEEWAPIKRNL